jgi:ferredoxin
MDRSVTTPFDAQADECIGCGACVFICPTGALHYEDVDGRRIMKELHTEVPMVSCSRCGRPFAAAEQVALVRQRVPVSPETAEMCPGCRKEHTVAAAEQALGKSLKGRSAACSAAAALGITHKTRC